MTTAIYIRVSTQDQNPDSQRQEIERWLAHNGYDKVVWFEDRETGKTLKRTGFQKLQKAISSGKVDAVVVWRLDRLARSFRDGISIITDWVGRGVRIISTTQQIDLSGVLGQAVASVLFAFAELELNAIKERQAAGIRAAKARGVYMGRKAGTTKSNPARARELSAKGLNPSEIAQSLGVSDRTVFRYLGDKSAHQDQQ